MQNRHAIILSGKDKSEVAKPANRIIDSLESNGFEVSFYSNSDISESRIEFDFDEARLQEKFLKPNTEIIIVLGGDGTILHACELVYKTEIPILGINQGHLGFLAETERSEIDEIIKGVIDKSYELEKRQVLCCEIDGNDFDQPLWALNDVYIKTKSFYKMFYASIGVNGEPVVSFPCDGVVFSTATGSTAYAFSNGAPVVWPEVESIMMSPIAAHTLFARTLMIGKNSYFELVVHDEKNGKKTHEKIANIMCDGHRSVDIESGIKIKVYPGNEKINFARFSNKTFTSRLVKKFSLPVDGWKEIE